MNAFIWMLFMILDILHKNPVIWHTKIESIIKFFLHQCKCVSIIWWFIIYTALKSVGDLWWSNQGIPGRTSDKNVIKIYHITSHGQVKPSKITRPFKMYQVDYEGLRGHVWIIPGSSTRVRSDPQLSGSDANLWYQALHWWNEEHPRPFPDVSGNIDSTIKGHLKSKVIG
jgi:hypothetical protein